MSEVRNTSTTNEMTTKPPTDLAETDRLGVTASERYLARLARHSFLSMWSHSNLYTDEGQRNGKGDGKELCDFMVVFDNHILLFSDKHCEFPYHENLEVSWARWYKRAVQKSVNQLLGAESWIRRFPNRIFLNNSCRQRFPVALPDVTRAIFHRIAVTRGSHQACRAYFGGQSTGSLMINTEICGDDHLRRPFYIGHVVSSHRYIHVLDELTLEVVLQELDTVYDLVAYLEKKERLLTKPGRIIMATGEEQLVAMYLTQINEQNEHDFVKVPDDVTLISIDEGHWESFIRNPQYRAKKAADQISYSWDRLIEHFIKYIRNEDTNDSIRGLSDLEPALRVLAAEPRLRRRQLAAQLVDALEKKIDSGQRFARLGLSSDFPDTAYVFLVLPKPPSIKSYNEYRDARKFLLLAYCKVAKLRATAAKRIVGIATEPVGTMGASEDLVLLETQGKTWTPEDENEARELQQQWGIFAERTAHSYETYVKEYPTVTPESLALPTLQKSAQPPYPMTRAQRRAVAREQRRQAKRRKGF